MKNPEDIEHTFRDAFDSFEEQPSGAVWERITEDREMKQRVGITDASPESIFSAAFRNFTSGPADAVWTGIRGYLIRKWWIRTLKWSSLFLAVGLISGIYIYHSSTKNQQTQQILVSKKNDSGNSRKQLSSNQTSHTIRPIHLPASGLMTPATSPHKNIILTEKHTTFNSSGIFGKPFLKSVESGNTLNEKSELQGSENKMALLAPFEESPKIQKQDEWALKLSNENASGFLTKEHRAFKARPDDFKKISNIVKYTKETDINNEESPWKIGVMAGLDYGNYNLKGGSKLYQEVRKGQELFNPGSFHAGLTFSRMLGSHWYIQSNVVYANQTMQAAYNRKVVQADTVRDGFGNIVRIDQKVIFNVDTNTTFRFTTLEIPLMVGFRIGERRWTFHAMGGPSWNLVLVASGAMLSPTSMHVESLQGMPLVKQQWGVWLAVGAGYQLNHHLSLTFEPVFRYKFNSVFSSGFPAKQYNYSSGVNLGLRYHIK